MHCNACALHTGEIETAISRLKELIELYDIARAAELLGGIANFPQFLETLDRLKIMFGRCIGCHAGGGWSECPMRKCCVGRELKSCYECAKMPCQELIKFQRKHLLTPAPHYGSKNC